MRMSGLLALGITLVVTGCSRNEPVTPAVESTGLESGSPHIVEINATVRSNLGITFAKVEKRRLAATLRVPGVFELRPLARHDYRMVLPGRVDLQVDQYDPIKPGDRLYRYQSPAWTEIKQSILLGERGVEEADAEVSVAQARLAEVKAQLQHMRERLDALAKAEFKNADLKAELAHTEASIPRLEVELKLAETKQQSAAGLLEQSIHRAASVTGISEDELTKQVPHNGEQVSAYRVMEWIDVVATETGVVERLDITDGAFVDPSATVLTTVDPGQVRFRATALQSDLAQIGAGTPSKIVPPRSKSLSINEAVDAAISLGLEAHPEQRTITVLAVPNGTRPWIRPGVSAFLELEVDTPSGPSLAIPLSSVVQDGITHVFFRRDPKNGNRAIRVEADMGVDDGRWVAINSGLALGDEVVLDGAYELKLATAQSGISQKGGHFHADGEFHAEH